MQITFELKTDTFRGAVWRCSLSECSLVSFPLSVSASLAAPRGLGGLMFQMMTRFLRLLKFLLLLRLLFVALCLFFSSSAAARMM